MDKLLHSLSGKLRFATLDLSNSYWQIEVEHEDREKRAFTLALGFFQVNTLPMGLANAAATCQRLMHTILKELFPSRCLGYQDDIIVFGTNHSDLLNNLTAVLERIRDASLTLNPNMCEFSKSKAAFLGHIVSAEGIPTNPDKVQKVRDWPTPQSAPEVQNILGLAGYCRTFIPAYARVAVTLTRLTEKGREFMWTQEYDAAFNDLKTALTSAPILAYPDLSPNALPFILDTDASSHAIGGVLSQVLPDGKEHVIS